MKSKIDRIKTSGQTLKITIKESGKDTNNNFDIHERGKQNQMFRECVALVKLKCKRVFEYFDFERPIIELI